MKLKKILAVCAAIAAFAGSVMSVSAATLRDIFDAEYYAEHYADLKAAFGTDKEKLYQHYVKYGLKEEREFGSPVLNVAAYRKAYPDLDKAFGDNWDAYVNHYFQYGVSEKRDKGVLFNPVQYADAYSDVRESCGNDLMAITKHYLKSGRKDGRTEGTSKGYGSIAALEESSQGDGGETYSVRQDYYDGSYLVTDYRKAGNVKLKETTYSAGGEAVAYEVYEYGTGGRLSQVTLWDKADGFTYRKYIYNAKGRLIRDETYEADGRLQVYSLYTYDAKGNLTGITSY